MPTSVLGTLFVGIGALVLLGSALWIGSVVSFVNAAEVASGEVVALNAGGSHPEVEFVPAGGATVRYPQGGLIYGYAVGDAVRVLYAPDDPSRAVIDDRGALWGFPIGGVVLGLVFMIVGWIARRSGRSV